jgi:hypothetical protein
MPEILKGRFVPGAYVTSLSICLLMAVLVGFSLYPGWFFYDSSTQWQWAQLIVTRGLPAKLVEYNITSHWPIFNTLVKAPFYWLTGEAGLYAFVQALLFNFSLCALGAAIIGRKSAWLVVYTLLVVVSPISQNYSVFQSSDTIVALCALAAVAMVCDSEAGTTRRIGWFVPAVLMMSLVRYNALPAAFLLTAVFCWKLRDRLGHAKRVVLGAGVVVALVVSVAGMRAYEHTGHVLDSAAEGVIMRLLDASHYTSDPSVKAAIGSFIESNPSLKRPLAPDCYAHGVWCAQMSGTAWHRLSTAKYMHAYLHLLIHDPIVFARVTWHFSGYQLGLTTPLLATQMGRTDIEPAFPSARMIFNARRLEMYARLQRTLNGFDSLAARGGVVCLLGMVGALALRRRDLVAAFGVLAVGYLVPLLLLANTNNFRYTFPVTIVAFAIVVAACATLARALTGSARARLRRFKDLRASPPTHE